MPDFRSFVALPIAGAVAATLLAVGHSLPATATEIKLAHFMSPRHPMDRFLMRPWSEQVAKMTDGALKVRIFPGGALGKGPRAQFKRAVDGIADIAFGVPGFTSKLFPRTGMMELPGMAKNAAAAANQMWDAMPLLAPEYKRVVVLGLWTNERQMLMTRDKPIRSVADLKDMKIRVPSKVQGEGIRALGAVPVSMPITRVYNAMNTGVIDGVLTGPSAIKSFKFGEVAKYFMVGPPLGRSPLFIVMNRDSFNNLSPAHQDIIRKTTGRELSVKGSRFYMRAGKKSLDAMRKSPKHEVIELTGKALGEFTERLFAARAQQVEALEKTGIPAKKILAAMGGKGS